MKLKALVSDDSKSLTADKPYVFGTEVIDVPLFQLCPDCSSPEVEGMEDYLGYFNVVRVAHDDTCPSDLVMFAQDAEADDE